MNAASKILVTGADQHQGLAVIRGLGLGGLPVVACGAEAKSIGFYSRYTVDRFVYTSPFTSKEDFLRDIVPFIRRTRPSIIIPAVESTLVILDEVREEVEQYAPLAAPPSETLRFTLDKWQTVELARRLQVPVPRTVQGSTLEDILDQAAALRFPVAVKPRGNRFYVGTAHGIRFKVRYANGLDELKTILAPLAASADFPLVQEFVGGTALCVSALFDRGEPLVLFPYRRTRETPLGGGVSVLRESIALDDRLAGYVTALLKEIKWHGVAMVEFKHDAGDGSYTLMEINPRFQASTALCLDAGLNLPYLLARLYTGELHQAAEHDRIGGYRVGVSERWLRGDLAGLYGHLSGAHTKATWRNPRQPLPSKARALWEFVRDFRPGMNYDEFKLYDWKPGAAECWGMLATTLAKMRR